MSPLLAHFGNYLGEVIGFLLAPLIYALQRLIRRAIAHARGKPWPPRRADVSLAPSGRDLRTAPGSPERREPEQPG